jgi:nitrate reductase (NAD(P)H)
VPLRDLLIASGVTEPSEAAQHVWFRGPLGELPKGDDGSYGTSIPLCMALDPACDVMVAFEQNGERLAPDHGFPLRVIIPGWIGGRMVKWLSEVCVRATPSTNHYHFNDNRILPPEVDAERAAAENWWIRPEYIFNELNINSAVRSPAHGEELLLQRAANVQPYTLRGYAYSGGGREVTRVELSCDDGLTWQLATLHHPFQATRYGRWWCWALWELTIDARALLLSPTLRVRAWDAANNTQPRDITWNVMGMGNNCHFAVHVHQSIAADGSVRLRFEHPTEPGALKGGWMGNAAGGWSPTPAGASFAAPLLPQQPPPLLPLPPPAAAAATTVEVLQSAPGGRTFTMQEVSRHCTEADCWIVVSGKVYDTTKCAQPSSLVTCAKRVL